MKRSKHLLYILQHKLPNYLTFGSLCCLKFALEECVKNIKEIFDYNYSKLEYIAFKVLTSFGSEMKRSIKCNIK